jgi:23S rRNA (guanosine2251-2'-O)-methyltransferase
MRLFGKNTVLERLRSDPATIKKLYLQRKTDLSDIVKEAKKIGIRFISLDKKEFMELAGDVHSQGVLAEVKEFSYTPLSEVIARASEGKNTPVFIDGVTDPQNLGSIIRSLACLGGFSVVLPEHDSAHVNETVLRVASGGENHVPISLVVNTVKGILKAKEKGIFIAGAVAEGGKDIRKAAMPLPLAVVIGSEGKGIRPGVDKCLDEKVSIPMRGASLSLNVAVATALVCYEISKKYT